MCRTQVLEHVVDEGTAMRVEVMLAQQVVEAVQRRLAPIARVLDAVDPIEVTIEADGAQHLLDVVARRVGEHELRAPQ